MRRVTDELRAAYQSLAEAEGEQPGHDYDRGYLTGWHDERRHIRRRTPDGGYREAARVAEFQLGYRQGREDGVGRDHDWWPTHARGPLPVSPYSEIAAQAATETPLAASGAAS